MPDDPAAPGRRDTKTRQSGRGRQAGAPQDIPAPGWKDIAWRTYSEISDNNIFLASGGVTYAVLLSLFPALAALVSIYGLVMDPNQIAAQVNALGGILPDQTRQLIEQELHQLVSASHGALGFGAVLGIVLAFWSASRGMSGLMSALDIAYEETESRSFLRFNMVALGLTVCFLVGGVLVLALIAGLPTVAQFMQLGGTLRWLFLLAQWPILIALWIVALAVLYRYAPDRKKPQWRWVSPGAITATLVWIIASVAFTVYVANFSSYNATYGSLGSVVVLLTWLYISSFAVLLGAVINAQSERQTQKDTTEDARPRPLGKRRAYAADTVGPSAE